jgi:hypothetical protein
MAFHKILDGILMDGPSLSLNKPKRLTLIKSKSYGSKNKEVKPQG